MSEVNPELSAEDRFAQLLAELEAQIKAGVKLDTAKISSLTDPDLSDRLLKAARCLKLLDAAWSSQSEHDPEPHPSSIDRFEIVSELGRGGFGIVYKALDPALGRLVALKVQRPETVLSAILRRRFLREAKAAASLNHPNIVTVYDVGEVSLLAWIAVEYCPGMSLAKWLSDYQTPAPPRLAAEIVASLAEAVAYAHSCRIWHRDIKPANVLLVGPNERAPEINQNSSQAVSSNLPSSPIQGPHASSSDTEPASFNPAAVLSAARIKLADFGLAKVLDESKEETVAGTMIGTPAYMAPEQIESRDQETGPGADVYGLGLILYELLTGKPAFSGGSRAEILQQVLLKDPTAPRKICRSIPRDLEAVTLQAIQKKARDRYASAAELAVDLRRFLADKRIQARRPGVIEQTWRWLRRRPATMIAAALLILVVGLYIANRRIVAANHALEGWIPISFTTIPQGARVVFVPLSPITGEPMPDKAVRPTQRTPLETELLPGDYFVVAVLGNRGDPDVRFHEVYRYVPKDPQEKHILGRYGAWHFDKARLVLREVEIPDHVATELMALVEPVPGAASSAGPVSVPFYMDCYEFTAADYSRFGNVFKSDRFKYRDAVLSNWALPVSFYQAADLAEISGKRLPTLGEYMSADEHRSTVALEFAKNADPPTEFGPVGNLPDDRTTTDPPIYGLNSGVAEWVFTRRPLVVAQHKRDSTSESQSAGLDDKRYVFGGDGTVITGNPTIAVEHRRAATASNWDPSDCRPGLGFRCVRSVRPQYLDAAE